MPKSKYYIGERSGHLEIIGFVKIQNDHYNRIRTQAICHCHKCGRNDYAILPYNFRKQKSCGCDRVWNSPPSGENSKLYRGYKGVSSIFLERARSRSERKKIPCDLTLEFLWELYEKQKKMCAISGEPIHLGENSRATGATASIDRIDPKKGYVLSNVQWVHVDINYMKHKFSTPDFFNWCKKIVTYNNLCK